MEGCPRVEEENVREEGTAKAGTGIGHDASSKSYLPLTSHALSPLPTN